MLRTSWVVMLALVAMMAAAGRAGAQLPNVCCLNDGGCVSIPPLGCGGEARVTCSQCPPVIGFCCTPANTCTPTITTACPPGSTYTTTCPGCPLPAAYCCTTSNCVPIWPPVRCPGTIIEPGRVVVSCAECNPTGACCLFFQARCEIRSQANCQSGVGEIWRGAGTACEPYPCPGTCCGPDLTCVQVSRPSNCTSVEEFRRETTCSVNACTLIAAVPCCRSDGVCIVTTSTACSALGGVIPFGTSCNPALCLAYVGACCRTDGSCAITTEAGCAASGVYLGGFTVCSPNQCAVGACCNAAFGTCSLLTRANCPAPNTHSIAGVCFPNPCPQPSGACCQTGGVCVIAAANQCTAPSVFFGAGVGCTPHPCAPGNDDCAGAIGLGGLSFDVAGTNMFANTTTDGIFGCDLGSSDVFYVFTPPVGGEYRIGLCESSSERDLTLSIYAACGDFALPIACGGICDPSPSLRDVSVIPSVMLTAGVPCTIRVAERNGFALFTGEFRLTGSILAGACCDPGSFACSFESESACAASGGVYGGDATTCDPRPCPPPNDDCAGAIALGGLSFDQIGTNAYANTTGDGILECGFGAADVFYTFTPAVGGDYRVGLCESSPERDLTLSIHSACGDFSTPIACGVVCDPEPSFRDVYVIPSMALSAGVPYTIRVASTGTIPLFPGEFRLTGSILAGACCHPNTSNCTVGSASVCAAAGGNYAGDATTCSPGTCPPANDDCAGAIVRTGTGFVDDGTTIGATTSAFLSGECGAFGSSDVFYTFTPSVGGNYSVTLCQTAVVFNSSLSVHDSCPGVASNQLACGENCSPDPEVFNLKSIPSVPMTAGVAYTIRAAVDGAFGIGAGDFRLRVARIPPPCPADFNDSGVLSVQDIFDFLAGYFGGDPRADFNGSGTISVQDIFDFLAAYFAGC